MSGFAAPGNILVDEETRGVNQARALLRQNPVEVDRGSGQKLFQLNELIM
jgi:hypothetical protein